MIPMHIKIMYHNTVPRPRYRYFYIPFEVIVVPNQSIMLPALTECQLELARQYFRYNDSSTYYLNKLPT
jgi:hypothetical protein